MAISLKYDIKGFNRVRNSLRKLASDHAETIDGSIEDFVKEHRAGFKSFGYPAQKKGPQPFKTDRQRRFFFWALRTGVIEVPYKRTGVLASSWRATKQGDAFWSLENSAAYAALVVGRGEQSFYHLNQWWVAEDIVEEDMPELTKDLTKDLLDLAKGMEGAI